MKQVALHSHASAVSLLFLASWAWGQSFTTGAMAGMLRAGSVAVLFAQATPIANGPYAAVQAERGKIVYEQRCSACHGSSLRGGANEYSAPALAGPRFFEKWNGRPLEELFLYTAENMPPGETPLPSAACLDVTAYILHVLKYPPGAAELTADSPALKLGIERRP